MKQLAILLLLLPGLAAAQTSGDVPLPDASPVPAEKTCQRAFYPPLAVKLHHSGKTKLRYLVEPDGTVKDPTVVESSGHAELDQASLDSVKCFHYKPAMKDGKPVEVPWTTTLNWSLSG